MLALPIILMILAFVVYTVGRIWLIVNAFRVSAGWGLAVLFLAPIGSFLFRINYREEARNPYYCGLAAILLGCGSYSTMPEKGAKSLTALTAKSSKSPAGADANAEPKKPSTVPGMFAAQKKLELQLKLVNLQRKSDILLERKASLAPGDRAGAVKLAEEIKQYNEELKTVTQEMRDRGIETAQR
jgi:hypothetical protein